MNVALPRKRQHSQLLAINFAAVEKLEKRKIRLTPVLEIENTGVFILNQPTPFRFWWAISMKGGLVENQSMQS